MDRPKQEFLVYEHTGGSAIAIAGHNFAVIGADSRLGIGTTIYSHNYNKLYELTPETVFTSTGCLCDSIGLLDIIRQRIMEYKYLHSKTMSTESIAQMSSIIMYNKRFFPFNVNGLLVGLNQGGNGAVYTLDSIGHLMQPPYASIGTASTLTSPVIDNFSMPYKKNTLNWTNLDNNLSYKVAQNIITDLFISAAERDIFTGDKLIIKTITNGGIQTKELELTPMK